MDAPMAPMIANVVATESVKRFKAEGVTRI